MNEVSRVTAPAPVVGESFGQLWESRGGSKGWRDILQRGMRKACLGDSQFTVFIAGCYGMNTV